MANNSPAVALKMTTNAWKLSAKLTNQIHDPSSYSIAKSMQSVLNLHTGSLAQLCFVPSHVS